MLEVVFSDSAAGTMAVAIGHKGFLGGATSVIISDGTVSKEEIEKFQHQAEERERSGWENAIPLEGNRKDIVNLPLALSVGNISEAGICLERESALSLLLSILPDMASEIVTELLNTSRKNYATLLLSLLIALLVISYLLGKLHRVRGQLFLIRDALNDIKAGNLNRRVLVRESDLTKQICYDINEIAMSSQSRLIQQKQSEQAYKRLMTSLSHDVKTPLASLVGYLEAVESKMVTGAEKEEYIRVAMEKAHHLKDFVTALFEWVKLDAGEQIFHFEVCDLNELSRDIMADWVPLLENHDLSYEIEIPETEYMTRVDSTAYTRILNNLLQNILTHSDASKVFLTVTETEQQAKIVVADNGNGIAASDLPHIFERMYQCDHSRSAKGNGLGLSIAKELVSIHKGTITAASVPGNGTTFIIILPKAL